MSSSECELLRPLGAPSSSAVLSAIFPLADAPAQAQASVNREPAKPGGPATPPDASPNQYLIGS